MPRPVTAAEPATRPRSVFADELAFAESLAARAGELLMERYERVERVDYKSARDVVTEVDHLSEELIIAAIRARYPDDGILAEENVNRRFACRIRCSRNPNKVSPGGHGRQANQRKR